MKKMVAMGSDGANVMLVCEKGIVTLFREFAS